MQAYLLSQIFNLRNYIGVFLLLLPACLSDFRRQYHQPALQQLTAADCSELGGKCNGGVDGMIC